MLLLGDKQSGTITRPLVALRDIVVFPGLNIPLGIGRSKSIEAVQAAGHQNYEVIFVAQKDSSADDPDLGQVYEVGTLARITQILRTPTGQLQVQVEGKERVRLRRLVKTDPYPLVEAMTMAERTESTTEIEALKRAVLSAFQQLMSLTKVVPMELIISIFTNSNLHRLVETIAVIVNPDLATRQLILETEPLKERLTQVLKLLNHELEVQQLSRKIESRTQGELGKMQKEVFLREQLKSIQKELGGEGDEYSELEQKIKDAGMSEATQSHALKELDRLRKMPSFGPEVSYIRTYLDWLVALPWVKVSKSTIDLAMARKVLDADHAGLEKVKDRILEYLAVQKLTKGKTKAQILCFVGPPGVGKTSIGKSIARALGREFIRISLGGVRDEAEIRGHRRTYVGAMPGRFIQAIKQAGTKNPVFMLDEIDKVGADFRGDPAAALLEALDPEQNHSFGDHYLEVPFDLSEVFFIATANILDTIPPALRDRLEIITYPGYTEDEKVHIAKDFLIPKTIGNHGLKTQDFKLSTEAVRALIRHYTREAGVRGLERQIAALARKIARQIAEGRRHRQTITERTLARYLGPIRFRQQMAEDEDEIGVVQGLAVTEAGGDVLSVEVTKMPGKGGLTLTGQLGDIMKESAQAAMSYTRARATKEGVSPNLFGETDWHIHVPAGAIPKDGPSAGVAMATALYSVATGQPVRHDVAMTGEVTLRGRVLEIGGAKEKILAAHRAGIRHIILPHDNSKDLTELPRKVKKEMTFTLAKSIDDVLPVALVSATPKHK
jgi:ATP-dependent Lon protease